MRDDPIEQITATGISTLATHHELDLVVLATGFDASTGGFTQIDIHSTDGTTLKDLWADGVKTQLGFAVPDFPNMLMLYGPQSPTTFCNGPTCAEVQGDWVIDCLCYLREHGYVRIEATHSAAQAWSIELAKVGDGLLFPQADSWYMGANIPGKKRELLCQPNPQQYLKHCRVCADNGYECFIVS